MKTTWKAPAAADVLLADGSIAVVRPLQPGDADALHALHEGVSEDAIRMRFFSVARHAAHASAITSKTWSAGTTTTTRSTGSGTEETEAYACTPSTASASGCTTLSRPAYPPDLMASRTARPSPPP